MLFVFVDCFFVGLSVRSFLRCELVCFLCFACFALYCFVLFCFALLCFACVLD